MEFQTHHVNCDSRSWELDISTMGSTMGILWLQTQDGNCDTYLWEFGTSTMGFYNPIMEFQTHHVNCDSLSWELDISRTGSSMGILWLPHRTVIPKRNSNYGKI